MLQLGPPCGAILVAGDIHMGDQVAAEKERLSGVLKERQAQVGRAQEGYMDLAQDVGKVYEASRTWYEVK
eukprot:gene10288-8210_t